MKLFLVLAVVFFQLSTFADVEESSDEDFDFTDAVSSVFRDRRSCQAIIQHNPSSCTNADCRGVVYGSMGMCASRDCKAIVAHNLAYCDTRDCRAVLLNSFGQCESWNCKAVLTHNTGLCR